jgi:hypothetical protein
VRTDIRGDAIREELEAIPEVERVFVEGPPWVLHLVCRAGAAQRGPLEAAVAVALNRCTLSAGDVQLQYSHLEPPEPRRRVRFVSSALERPRAGWAVARAAVEWQDVQRSGEAEGESNPTFDLRLAALATVRAIQQIVPAAPSFHVVGIKAVRVFDQDLVVVLIRGDAAIEHPLVGTSLVTGDPARSAGLAVLNALNRFLGNYLAVSD